MKIRAKADQYTVRFLDEKGDERMQCVELGSPILAMRLSAQINVAMEANERAAREESPSCIFCDLSRAFRGFAPPDEPELPEQEWIIVETALPLVP